MIGRRNFSFGLGALCATGMVGPATAWADEMAPAKKKKKKPPKDIPDTPLEMIPNHRQYMRDIVIELSAYAKNRQANFSVLVRDAPELLIKEKREWDWQSARDPDGAAEGKFTAIGSVDAPYLNAIDGMLFDGLVYGHDTPDQPSDPDDSLPLLGAARLAVQHSRRVFAIEYAKNPKFRAAILKQLEPIPAIPFFDGEADKILGVIAPDPINENARHITSLSMVRNFLPLLDNRAFSSHESWVAGLGTTNYDLLLLNAFWRENSSITAAEVTALKFKRLGAQRLVYAELPLGRARQGAHYWKWDWHVGAPAWLDSPEPDRPDSYLVQYWDPDWKEIIGKYLVGLMDLGFDGVLFDSLDSYLHFEELMPL